MHPDQFTPDSHRTQGSEDANDRPAAPPLAAEDQHLVGSAADVQRNQAPPAHAPAQDQASDAIPPREHGDTEVRTPSPTQPRTGEAGNDYVGRQMDDDLKANPRVDDARRVQGGQNG